MHGGGSSASCGGSARRVALVVVLVAFAGCAASPGRPSWGGRWPSGAELTAAAAKAARSPATWIPLAGAAALSVSGRDDDLSDWAADHQPVFGHDAASASDHLLAASEVVWGISALAAPSADLGDKATGVLAQGAALAVEAAATRSIKNLADRRRPDHSNHQSFPSGHAGFSSAATTLTRRNLDYMAMPGWLDTSLRVGLHGLALSTGWARVEARRHYPTDILVGYAFGQFVATFVSESFMSPADAPVQVSFQPLPGGGTVTLVLRRF